VRSVLVIPLRSHDRTIGLLRVDHHIEEHRWTREEVALIRGGADLLVAYVLSRRVSQSAKEGRS
jgi:GAF domain-containing protein